MTKPVLFKLTTDKTVSDAATALHAAVHANHFGVMQIHNLKETMAKKGIEFAAEFSACLIMNQASLESRDYRDRPDAKGDACGMKAKAKTTSRKLGDDRNETANKARPLDKNFKQSRDIHEDRGTRQMKTGTVPRPSQGK